MSVGEVENPDGGPAPEPAMEPDVPKPAFELPPDDDKPDEPAGPASPQQAKVPNKVRHQNRGQDLVRLAREAADRERARSDRLEREMAELRGRFEERSRMEQRPKADARQQQLDDVAGRIERALERMANGDTNARAEWK